jgi:hypothetical protein
MSTTLIPPNWYSVKPHGQTARVFPTIAQAATTLVMLGRTPASVSAITGSRTRSLTETELRELGQRVRAHRASASNIRAAREREKTPSDQPLAATGDHTSHGKRRTPAARRNERSELSRSAAGSPLVAQAPGRDLAAGGDGNPRLGLGQRSAGAGADRVRR